MKPKVAIFHPPFHLGGGSEVPALWTAQALSKDCLVTLFTMGSLDLEEFNRNLGTTLDGTKIEVVEIPIPKIFSSRYDALRCYRLHRAARRAARDFDLLISTYNVMSFGKGRRGVQFIADFSFSDRLRRRFDVSAGGKKRLTHGSSPLRWIYIEGARFLAGNFRSQWHHNVTVCNSRWSRDILKDIYDVESSVIYPPVREERTRTPWDKKENGFLFIGRPVPEKGILDVVRILTEVRRRGWKVHLHVLGDNGLPSFRNNLEKIRYANRDWMFLEGLVLGQEKQALLSRHRFGISGRRNEPFGIAVAEMVKAGCITWVPQGGGQTEIVDHPDLIFENTRDAADKIVRVLGDESLATGLHAHLDRQGWSFSSARFCAEIRSFLLPLLKAKM